MTDCQTKSTGRTARTSRAFTLIELLVVIAIIAILAGIGIFGFNRFRSATQKNLSKSLFHGIETGLRTYMDEMACGPPPSYGLSRPNWSGGHWLAQAMLGMDGFDRVDGPGFRLVDRGPVHGPYINVDLAQKVDDGNGYVLIDGHGQPIMYYKFDPALNSNNGGYDASHNDLSDSLFWAPGGPSSSKGVARFGPPDPSYYPQANPPPSEGIDIYARHGGDSSLGFIRRDYVICTPGADELWWGRETWNGTVTNDRGDDYHNLDQE